MTSVNVANVINMLATTFQTASITQTPVTPFEIEKCIMKFKTFYKIFQLRERFLFQHYYKEIKNYNYSLKHR